MDVEALEVFASRLGEAAVDPSLWPGLLQGIAESMGAVGAVLLQAGMPTEDVPWSPSLMRMREAYYGGGWNTRDLRAIRSAAAVRRGLTVLVDEDIASRDEVAREPYYSSFLASQGLAAFAAVAFRSSPSEVHGLVLQRTPSQGAFDEREKGALALLAPRLTATAELARMLGETSLRTGLDVLDRLSRPAMALGAFARIVGVNAAAGALLDEDFGVRRGTLVVRDERAAAEIAKACAEARTSWGATAGTVVPIVVRREGRLPLVLRPVVLDGPAASFFFGARLLVTVSDPGKTSRLSPHLLADAFAMTASESRLAIHLAAGLSLQQAATAGRINVETVRSQLKVLFAKTGTRRQAMLVALLGRL